MKIDSAVTKENFNIEIVDGISVIKFNSMRATLSEANSLKHVLDSLITANHYKLILDFSETQFLDSAIASVMIKFVKEIRKMKGDILTITPPGIINKFFIQTRLDKIFKQFNTKEQALISFSSV